MIFRTTFNDHGMNALVRAAIGLGPHTYAFAKHFKIKPKNEPNNILTLELDENVRLDSYVIVTINK